MRRGFSLVELAIVLVILGLLTGGVLAGRSLIRASELRAVGTEYQRYKTAAYAFKDKYFAIPGDFSQATRVWGDQATGTGACASGATADGNPGTCNGNGDGVLNASTAGASGETMRLWQHLALAGLIEGTYSGVAGAGTNHAQFGTNTPASKLGKAGWSAEHTPNFAGNSFSFAFDYSNSLHFGAETTTGAGVNAVIRPEEAWNFDTKYDDGLPGRGKVIARYWNNACAAASSFIDYNAPYNLTVSTTQCALYFPRSFY